MSRVRQAHRVIAIFVALFIIVHLATHLTAWGGIAAHGRALEATRLLYRNPVIEPLLIVALITQIALGITLALRRWRAGPQRGWAAIQLASGVALGLFILVHSSAALSARWQGGIDTNFYWPAGTLVLSPLKFGFAPYYAMGLVALFTHLAAALHFRGSGRWARALLAFAPVAAAVILLPFTGALYDIQLPTAHREYFAVYLGAVP